VWLTPGKTDEEVEEEVEEGKGGGSGDKGGGSGERCSAILCQLFEPLIREVSFMVPEKEEEEEEEKGRREANVRKVEYQLASYCLGASGYSRHLDYEPAENEYMPSSSSSSSSSSPPSSPPSSLHHLHLHQPLHHIVIQNNNLEDI